MLIFSTIATIISPIIYLFPFLFLWKNEGHAYYVIPRTEKEIKNKYVFIAKLISLTILSVLFVFTWPKKVMFYPIKVVIFVFVLLIIQFLTSFCLEFKDGKNKVWNKSVICFFVLLALAILLFWGWGICDEKVEEDPFESIETFQIEHISNGNVFFYDETDKSLEVISISDDSLEIVLQENNSQLPYVEKITTHARYSDKWEKNKVIYYDMSTLNERYVLYVSKNDLYK